MVMMATLSTSILWAQATVIHPEAPLDSAPAGSTPPGDLQLSPPENVDSHVHILWMEPDRTHRTYGLGIHIAST